jgi:ABC-2 type transport system permease protein
MRTILYLIRKEFLQIFRNKFTSRAVFLVPIFQMLILVPAVTFEIKNITLCIIDRDMSPESRGLINRLEGSNFFKISSAVFDENNAIDLLHRNKCLMFLDIPSGFGKDLGTGKPGKIMAAVNAIDGTTAQLAWGYFSAVTQDYNISLLMQNPGSASLKPLPRITINNRYWYNENLNYNYYMLPGVLVILVVAIGFMLAGLNMVREKEIGTIEQINVTPVKKYQFIIAKMIPFLVIGLIDLSIGLIIGKIVFNIPFLGSVPLLLLSAFIFILSVLGLSLFISTFSGTQQQFVFSAFFFMIVFILMSGIFTPFESMPIWAQKFDLINPIYYLIRINRMVMLKGSTIHDISRELWSLTIIAICFTTFAVRRYRKTA